MNGYVAITDYDWFSFLRAQPDLEEVNFWQPSSKNLLNPAPGMPFFFKLRARYGSFIVGFGHFAWRTKLPAWMAWEVFDRANGAPDRLAMLARISRLRKDREVDRTGKYEIGCLVIAHPTFFPEALWITPPSDWPKNVERGKSYDITAGEGHRIHVECEMRALELRPAMLPTTQSGEAMTLETRVSRFGKPILARPRLGQGGFRVAVADVYDRQCAVSTEHSLPALEAAHIRPYAEGGEHDISNGLLLRADIHRLFDKGFVTVTPEYQFRVSPRLQADYENGRAYYELEEKIRLAGGIHLPRDLANRPSPELLHWHSTERFVR